MHAGVVLVGYRASGKTSMGRSLAQRLRLPFVDADQVWERRFGERIADCFVRQGAEVFRDREEQVLADLLADPQPCVLATGGGVVERPANRERLASCARPVLYLCAPAAVLQERLRRDGGGRPALQGANPADEVPEILARREGWYRAVATQVIDAARPSAVVLAACLAALPAGPKG